jgi:NTE family protein
MKCDLVLEGGGCKAIGFVGAIERLKEEGYSFNQIAGVSAGSIVGSLLSVGYTGTELKDIISNLDYTKFLSTHGIQSIPKIGKYISLIKNKGMYDGNYIETWLENLLEAKGKTTFGDIMDKNGQSKLKIITTELNSQQLTILPDDLPKYNIDPKTFKISKAVRISISIPFFFTPVRIDYKDKNNAGKLAYFVDGGCLSNFPVWIFDIEGIPKFPTIGLKLGSDTYYNGIIDSTPIKNYLSCIIETMIDKNEEVFLRDKDSVRTIAIPTCGVSTTEFNLPHSKTMELYQSGYDSAKTFLETWNFDNYVKKHRAKH